MNGNPRSMSGTTFLCRYRPQALRTTQSLHPTFLGQETRTTNFVSLESVVELGILTMSASQRIR